MIAAILFFNLQLGLLTAFMSQVITAYCLTVLNHSTVCDIVNSSNLEPTW